MRAEQILQEKVREFLDGKLARLEFGADGSVAEKVFAIYALFQDGVTSSTPGNTRIAKEIWDCMENPAELFSRIPRNSGIMALNIQCEFRRQLLTYIQNLVPDELRENKMEAFENAFRVIGQIETQLSAYGLRSKGIISVAFFLLGLGLVGLYANNCWVDGGLTIEGSFWGAVGALLILGASILGAHTQYVSYKQKKTLRLFQNVEPTESTALISSGNIQMGSYRNDWFPEESLMRVAAAKLSKTCDNNEDVTFQSEERTQTLVFAAAGASL